MVLPQNIYAVAQLEKAGLQVSFGAWMLMGLIFCSFMVYVPPRGLPEAENRLKTAPLRSKRSAAL